MFRQPKITLSLVASFILVNNIYAQQSEQLDTVTVTAQKVEENIQEVPISISLFDEFAIEDRKINSVKDIAQYTPNFNIFNPGDFGTVSPTIRGLYSDPTMVSTTVSMYIDGVPTQNTIGYDSPLEDIERIEVLRGPQGTLYGKNAEAGAINIITKKPDNETRAKLGVELGSDNKREYAISASGPIIEDKFYMGFSAKHYEKDGFMTNTYFNNDHNNRKNRYGKVNLRYTPTDNLELSFISSKGERDDGALSVNQASAADLKVLNNNLEDYAKLESTTHALKIDYDLGQYNLSSVTSYKKDHDDRLADYDYSTMTFMHSNMDVVYKNLSQELKLNSQTDTLTWLVGLYTDKSESSGGSTVDSISEARRNGSTNRDTDDDSLGIFTHANYKMTDKLSILGGLRYDRDEKNLVDNKTNVKLDLSYSEVSPKLAINYKLDKTMMGYITLAKGYRSGGFYMFAPTGQEIYDKETLWNYELGLKSQLFDNRLVLNTSIYYMDISDMQVLTDLTQNQAYISNAATATSKGVEIEANYNATDEISLFSAFGFNKTIYDKFSDASGDYSGNYASFSPKYNFSIGAQYRSTKGYYARVDVNGYGEMYIDKANKYKQDAYELVNTKIGYEQGDFDIYLYGKNIFDKEYNIEGYYSGFFTYLSDPREIGIQLNYRF